MKKVIFTGIFVLAIFLTACVTSDKKSLSPDNYEAGNDMQYFQTSEGAKGSPIQEMQTAVFSYAALPFPFVETILSRTQTQAQERT